MALLKSEPEIDCTNRTANTPGTAKGLNVGFHEDGVVLHENLEHVEFEKLPKLMNGISLLAFEDTDRFTQNSDLYKMRIANPVR